MLLWVINFSTLYYSRLWLFLSAKECRWFHLLLRYPEIPYDISLHKVSVSHYLFKSCDSTLDIVIACVLQHPQVGLLTAKLKHMAKFTQQTSEKAGNEMQTSRLIVKKFVVTMEHIPQILSRRNKTWEMKAWQH